MYTLTAQDSTSEQEILISQSLQCLHQLAQHIQGWELRKLLSGPYDQRDAYLVVQAGVGGLDAMDWAAMLERMYERWCDTHKFGVSPIQGMLLGVTGSASLFQIMDSS